MYFTLQLRRSWPSFMPWRPSQKQRKLPGVFRHSSAHTRDSHSSTSDRKVEEMKGEMKVMSEVQRVTEGRRSYPSPICAGISQNIQGSEKHQFHELLKNIYQMSFLRSTYLGMQTTLESSGLWRWLGGITSLSTQPYMAMRRLAIINVNSQRRDAEVMKSLVSTAERKQDTRVINDF